MPRKKRRRHSPELKAKVALEAIKGLKTAGELAAEYEVHPGQISQWKRQLLDEVPEIFERGYKNSEARAEQRESELYEQVGRLKMELEGLKKKPRSFRSRSPEAGGAGAPHAPGVRV